MNCGGSYQKEVVCDVQCFAAVRRGVRQISNKLNVRLMDNALWSGGKFAANF